MSRRWVRFAALAVLLAGLGGVLYLRGRGGDGTPKADVEAARSEMSRRRYAAAREIVERVLAERPGDVDATFVLAECLTKERRHADALTAYESVLAVAKDPEDQKVAYQCAGELLLTAGKVDVAEKYFEEALERDPDFPSAHNRLAFLLGLEGRRWEAAPHLVELVKQDRFSPLHLMLLANPNRNIAVDDFLTEVSRKNPGFPVPRIAEAKAAMERGRTDEADRIIREVLAYDPQQTEAQMVAGAVALVRGDEDAFVRWSSSLTLRQEAHPECWRLRGRWARQNGDHPAAIRCFAEAFFRDPNSLEACQSLAQLLSKTDEEAKVVEHFRDRALLLEQLETAADLLYEDQRDLEQMKRAFACCDWLERYWEAWGWCRAALELDPTLDWARSQKDDIGQHLVYDLPQTVIYKNINDWDYSRYPLPTLVAARRDDSKPGAGAGSVAFREVGADLGLAFAYEEGHQADPADQKQGRRMYEVPGGGVAAIDFDSDLYPDLYFGQGGNGPGATGDGPTDRLFRNLSGLRFADVTEASGLREAAYTQGVSAADFDNDGFPDLYVGNIGANRLFRNNGDGTFADASGGLPRFASTWTSSTAIADLDGDGNPDLFDVTYLKPEAYDKTCDIENGYHRACNPRIFPAEPDRILSGRGDGTFEELKSALPEDTSDGRGLGILIADYLGTGRPQVFIANDMTANHFFVPRSAPEPAGLSYANEALVRGVAFDERGRAQACMGVAFGDFDRNGEFDLYITNFFGDHSTLYLQEAGAFTDLSHSSNVAAISYQFLGFGTQPLDADLDGDLDLFVANGHIDDFRFQNLPYRMRPQFLVNDGAAKFAEVASSAAGPYFSRELLGRAAARLDWNRDGREDVAVSHLDDPAVLVSNESRAVGQAVRLSLVGTEGARDPLGAAVELTEGDEVRIAQVTAGSGYQASNEPLVVLPVLGDGPVIVRVRWPGGGETELKDMEPGRHYKIVEGAPRPFMMP